MKIGVVTITNGENYGNRLQNYAVQEALKEVVGADVETIHKTTNVFDSENIYYITKLRLKKLLHYHITPVEKRRLSFYRFTHKYIKRSPYKIGTSVPDKLNGVYDYFIAGSDQVWNPYLDYVTPANFLVFTESTKKIAFAPSIAVSAIPEENRKDISNWIQDFRLLSVREQAGADLIYRLCGRNAEVLSDPTLFLRASEWKKIEKSVQVEENKYILCYFLGECKKEYREKVNSFAAFFHYDIYWLQTEEHFDIAPDEFLYLIDHAAVVCTDSFHGTVFSIIFQTNFVYFDRSECFEDMSSRLKTLTDRFDMHDRYFKKVGVDTLLATDFSNTKKIIEDERKKTIDFLQHINSKGEENV